MSIFKKIYNKIPSKIEKEIYADKKVSLLIWGDDILGNHILFVIGLLTLLLQLIRLFVNFVKGSPLLQNLNLFGFTFVILIVVALNLNYLRMYLFRKDTIYLTIQIFVPTLEIEKIFLNNKTYMLKDVKETILDDETYYYITFVKEFIVGGIYKIEITNHIFEFKLDIKNSKDMVEIIPSNLKIVFNKNLNL